jgi:hypothetical protein
MFTLSSESVLKCAGGSAAELSGHFEREHQFTAEKRRRVKSKDRLEFTKLILTYL